MCLPTQRVLQKTCCRRRRDRRLLCVVRALGTSYSFASTGRSAVPLKWFTFSALSESDFGGFSDVGCHTVVLSVGHDWKEGSTRTATSSLVVPKKCNPAGIRSSTRWLGFHHSFLGPIFLFFDFPHSARDICMICGVCVLCPFFFLFLQTL